jgi:hypothetical protein
MTKPKPSLLLAILLALCAPCFGQTIKGNASAKGNVTTVSTPVSGSSMPGYNGVDLVPWGTVPNFSSTSGGCAGQPIGSCNNNATGYDNSFIGGCAGGVCHNFLGDAFTNAAFLSPVTRVTDAFSVPGTTYGTCQAGQGGSGVFTLTSTNTSLVALGCTPGGGSGSFERVCLFNTATGHCTSFITTNLNTGGGGSSSQAQDFGSLSFSLTDSKVGSSFNLYTFGYDEYDITQGNGYDPTTVFPYTINSTTGAYTLGTGLVNWKYGLPMYNASNWTTSHSYTYGDYVIHPLATTEMATSGAWTAGHTYATGDIVVAQSGAACMYRVISTTLAASTGTSPAFDTTLPCGNSTLTETGGSGVKWRGTNSAGQFLYQDIASGTHTSAGSVFQWLATPATLATNGSITSGAATMTSSSNPFTAAQVGQAICVTGAGNSAGTVPLCTTIFSYGSAGSVTLATPALHTVTTSATVTLSGHPDFYSSTVGDANGLIWVNLGPSYIPASSGQLWTANAGISRDTLYPGGTHPCKYGIAISTNSYGDAYPSGGYNKYNNSQGSGIWAMEYVCDPTGSTGGTYELVNTATGIWTNYACGTGTGYTCASITPSIVGTLTNITNPLSTGQPCPYYLHNQKMSKNGLHAVITNQANVYPVCDSLQNFPVWQTTASSFNAVTSMQFTPSGLNHWDIGTDSIVAFNPSGYTGGFLAIYDANNPTAAPPFSVYLKPGVNTSPPPYPEGCNTAGSPIPNPDCTLSNVLDSHLSVAGDDGTDTVPACGTSYNYQTLGPAFNAWQNMETCYPVTPTATSSSVSYGPVWQFTHSFDTGTSNTFSIQFQISQYSQDGAWLFWGSDWNCGNGSETGAPPAPWTSGTYYQKLAITASPASPSNLCGLPWEPATTYVTGNMINPIEGTGGSGQVDDVFQAIYVSSGGTSGPAGQPGGGNNQPVCVVGGANKSCFVSTNPPLCNGLDCGAHPSSTPFTAGDTICDNQNYDGATHLNSINPTPPYSTSCPNGIVWQDIGPQTSRGDVFAVELKTPFHL